MTDRIRDVFETRRLRRGVHARRSSTRERSTARDDRRPARLPGVRRAGQRARAAHRHDDADRAGGRDPLRRRRAPAALLLLRPRLPRRAPPARAVARVPAGRGRADRRHRARRGPPRCWRCCARRWTPPGCENYRVGLGDASLYPALLEASGSAPSGASGSSPSWPGVTSSASSTRSHELGLAQADAELLLSVPRHARRVRDPARAWTSGCTTRSPGCGSCVTRLAPEVAAADHLRPRAGALDRLLHRRGVPGLRPRLRCADRQRRPLRRAAGQLRTARCPPSASRSTSSACTSRSPARRRQATRSAP